jgi:hypothetical protein
MFNVQKHVSAMFEETRKKGVPGNAFIRTAKAIPVGHTSQEECIILILQGIVAELENKVRFNGGWFLAISDELGFDELRQDLEDFEREARAEIEEMLEQATSKAKKRGQNK